MLTAHEIDVLAELMDEIASIKIRQHENCNDPVFCEAREMEKRDHIDNAKFLLLFYGVKEESHD